MNPRFLADANFKRAIPAGMRRLEPSVDFLFDPVSLKHVPDSQVLVLAAREGRILVSHDLKSMPRHYRDFLASGEDSPGVILIGQRVPLAVAIHGLMLIWGASEAEEWINKLTYLPL